jgi:hypothetical protein
MITKLTFVLVFSIMFFSCDLNERKTEVSIDENERDTVFIRETDTVEIQPENDYENARDEEGRRRQLTITDKDFAGNTFPDGRITLEYLKRNFKDYEVVNREPFQNRHVQGQVDTIYTVRAAGGSSFRIYKLPEESLLERAEIVSSEIRMNRDVRVGMTTNNFLAAFPQVNERLAENARVTVKGDITPVEIDLYFADNRLQRVIYKGYVD